MLAFHLLYHLLQFSVLTWRFKWKHSVLLLYVSIITTCIKSDITQLLHISCIRLISDFMKIESYIMTFS